MSLTALNNHYVIDNHLISKNDSTAYENRIKDAVKIEIDKILNIDKRQGFNDLYIKSANFELPDLSARYLRVDFKNYSENIQKWIGHIVEINETSFTAKLEDLNEHGTYEIGEFNIQDEVSEEDKELLKIGAIFYLSIGKIIVHGQIENKSILRFQRLIDWTEDDYNAAIDRAAELDAKIKWE